MKVQEWVKPSRNLLILIGMTILFCVPFVIRSAYILHVLILALLWIGLGMSWNLMAGYAGLFSFAHGALLGIGAYVSALIVMRLGVSPWISIIIGGLFAALVGLAIGAPCLRLKELAYFALATIAFGEIARIIVFNWVDLTRGSLCLSGIPSFQPSPPFGGRSRIPEYYLILIITLAITFAVSWLVKSPLGLKWMAIREDQDAAASLGINLTKLKLSSFVISAFMAGVLGGFYAHYVRTLSPDLLGLTTQVTVLINVLAGGLGTILGPYVGTFVLVFATEALREIGQYRLVVYGIAIILIILFFPEGLLKKFKDLIAWIKSGD